MMNHKRATTTRNLYLPVSLRGHDQTAVESDALLFELGHTKQIWVRGASGMGKSALCRELEKIFFHVGTSAFDAYRKFGFVAVFISARHFSDVGGDDRRDPSWLIDGIRFVLGSGGMTLENDRLVRAMLRTGILGIVIDGLNEVARAHSLDAFVDEFPNTRILVTSQDEANYRFTEWRLPSDMGDYVKRLLELYLGAQAGGELFTELENTGLRLQIRSGYDVRLVADLSSTSAPSQPKNRTDLYAAAIAAAWPSSNEDQERIEHAQLAAAAWKLLSAREPNEDKHRLKPGADLSSQLLESLARAPEQSRRNVRLLRQVGREFEFVHFQMNAFLAAHWLVSQGETATGMRGMIEESKIWKDTKDAQRTLWEFVAAMLADTGICALWREVRRQEEWDTLRRALENVADDRQIELTIGRRHRRPELPANVT